MTQRRHHVGPRLPLAIAAVLTIVACEARPPAPAAPTRVEPGRRVPSEPRIGGTAVIAAASDITGVNPLLDATTDFNQEVLDALFLRLFEEQPDFTDHPPTFEPRLATDWEWSDDGRELGVTLRPDVVWSDGTPVTADDVVWTWQLQTHPEIAWSYAQSKEAIRAIEALGPHRLRVLFTSPAPSRLAELNEGPILPRHRWRELPADRWRGNGGWFVDNLVVNGPFRLASWQPEQEIVLERNPSYYRAGYPRLDRVVFRIVPERNNRLTQLLAGAVDFIDQVPASAAAQIRANPETRLESFQARQYNFVCWNLSNPLFARSEARLALTLAIDRRALVETLWYGYAEIASSPIPSNVWAHRAEPGPWPHDPSRARELLAGLGWQTGDDGVLVRNGRRFEFDLLTNADSRVRVDAAAMIQEDLRQVGVAARPRTLELNTVNDLALKHRFDALLTGINIDTTLDLGYGFHSDSIDGGLNLGGYSNPEVDALIERARAATAAAEQGRLLDRIQEILHREQPLTFLWEPRQLNGVRHRLRGVRPNPLSALFALEEWWLAP